jgi:hypothetical protein
MAENRPRLGPVSEIKNPRLKGSKTGGEKALIGLRRPLREEKRETTHIVC